MIFVTVGTQIPFDRLVKTVDTWATQRGRMDVFFQVGRGGYVPQSGKSIELLESKEFRERLGAADLVISHAGMGTILSVIELQKPLIVLPRLTHLGEVRNDHQKATIERLSPMGLFQAAEDENHLLQMLDAADKVKAPNLAPTERLLQLIARIRGFLESQAQ